MVQSRSGWMSAFGGLVRAAVLIFCMAFLRCCSIRSSTCMICIEGYFSGLAWTHFSILSFWTKFVCLCYFRIHQRKELDIGSCGGLKGKPRCQIWCWVKISLTMYVLSCIRLLESSIFRIVVVSSLNLFDAFGEFCCSFKHTCKICYCFLSLPFPPGTLCHSYRL